MELIEKDIRLILIKIIDLCMTIMTTLVWPLNGERRNYEAITFQANIELHLPHDDDREEMIMRVKLVEMNTTLAETVRRTEDRTVVQKGTEVRGKEDNVIITGEGPGMTVQ